MKGIIKLLICGLCLTQLTFAAPFGGAKVEKMNWGDLEVVFIEDNLFPTYLVQFYFADGSMSDEVKGSSDAMFNLLSSGTRRYSQKDIADNLEFFGVSHGARVTHEFSTYSVSGLVKDSVPTMKMICHLFADATFPQVELNKTKTRAISSAENMVNNHGALASLAFREISLEGSPFAYPVSGKIRDVRKMKRQNLLSRLKYFKNEVKMRVYITGPKDILSIRPVIANECGFKGQGHFIRTNNYKKVERNSGPRVVLVTVPMANQAKVRIGRFLNKGEYENSELTSLMSEYLGGGFTSKLVRELRVKRNLTYSVSAYAARQKDYGRAAISTSTANEKLGKLLNVTKDVVSQLGNGELSDIGLNRAKGSLVGSYPFRFEQNSAYINQLLFFDHVGKSYDELYKFEERVRSFEAKDVARMARNTFGWEKQTILVVGSRKLLPTLKKLYGKVEVKNYQSFL